MVRRSSAALAAQARGAPPNDWIEIAVPNLAHLAPAQARGALTPGRHDDTWAVHARGPAQSLGAHSAPRNDAAPPRGALAEHGAHQSIVMLLLIAC